MGVLDVTPYDQKRDKIDGGRNFFELKKRGLTRMHYLSVLL